MAAPLLQLAIAKIAAALSLSTASHRPAHHDKVRISEIMEAPNIAQEENKKLRHRVVYTHLLCIYICICINRSYCISVWDDWQCKWTCTSSATMNWTAICL